jgi:serine protease Do
MALLAACSADAQNDARPPPRPEAARQTTPAEQFAAPRTAEPAATVSALPDFTGLVERYGDAVVNVSVVSQRNGTIAGGPPISPDDPLHDFFRRFGIPDQGAQPVRGQGSGFIMSPDGYVLTNAHVVAQADEVTVRLTDRREFRAKVVGVDSPTDVAVLKFDAQDLPTVRLGDPNRLQPGEWVVAIGAPFGLENSVTAGVVSATSRALGPEQSLVPFIQTDVAVNPGNSGGPLFNLKGEVVGINSVIYSRTGGYQGVSFAIPIDVAMNVQQQLVKTGRVVRGRIGVTIQDIDAQLAQSFGLDRPRGALVSSVEQGGPAARAGLQPGDVILAVNNARVSSIEALRAATQKAGGSVALLVQRDDAQIYVPVRIATAGK